MTEFEWNTCEYPCDMLGHLDGKINDEEFMRFSVACCRRIWSLITDPRSRAVVDATEAYLNGSLTAEAAGDVCAVWTRGCLNGDVTDLAGGLTTEAIDSVCGLGDGHAANVSIACFQAVGYAATQHPESQGVPQATLTKICENAEYTERLAQCQLVRDLFQYA